MDKDLQRKIDKARWYVLKNSPFYGQVCMGLMDQLSDVPTACTDGKRIIWGRSFLNKLTPQETRFVLLHETLHPSHQHLWRLPIKEEAAQKAADYEINLILKESGLDISMPQGGLLDYRFRNLSCEEIYKILKKEEQNKPKKSSDSGDGSGNGIPDPGGCGAFSEPDDDENNGNNDNSENGQDQNENNEVIGKCSLKEQWDRRVLQAVQAARALGKGDVPGDFQRIIDRIQAQDIDWKQELADFIKTNIGTRNDWSRSNRRFATAPVIYPRKRKDQIGKIACLVDVSGSISDRQINEFNSLIENCIAEVTTSAIVFYTDARVQLECEITAGEALPTKVPGGGGTDFRCVFSRLNRLIDDGESIAGLVAITDLYATLPQVAPDFPVLWVCNSEAQTAPFGRIVYIKDSKT